MNPKHCSPQQKRFDKDGNEFWAHAPYNFVPLPEKAVTLDGDKIPGHDEFNGITGFIDCLLTTRSPLYTRSAMDPEFFKQWGDKSFHELREDQKKKLAQCFSLDNAEVPVIPGSSLRGMLRTIVEIISFSKVQPVTNRPFAFRAVGDRSSLGEEYRSRFLHKVSSKRFEFKMHAGFIYKHGKSWKIIPAEPLNGAAFARVEQSDIPKDLPKWHNARNAFQAYVALAPLDYYPHANGKVELSYVKATKVCRGGGYGLKPAIIVKTDKIKRKHQEFVFGYPLDYPNTDPNKSIQIKQDLLDAYRDQLTESQQRFLGNDGVLQDWQPVFYLIENDNLAFFGHAMMFRLPYFHSPADFIPQFLHNEEQTDLSEALFGYAGKAQSEGHHNACAGRVFFGDARFESAKDGIWLSENPITPKVLASPKPTTFQHYLVQDKSRQHDPDVKRQLAHYATPTQETAIRGHKSYWHRGNIGLDEIQEIPEKIAKAPKQYTRIKPVKAGVSFCFRIHFENLRNYELGALLWALALPGENDKDYCHSIGMGKPLGLGAIKIIPKLHLINRIGRYVQLFEGTDWQRCEREEHDILQYICAFEEFILQEIDSNERGQAKSLKEVQRIKMLLKMLEWPGPDRSLTEYMTIEPSNEYKERPVLPNPDNIQEPSSNRVTAPQRPKSHQKAHKHDDRRRRR
jgi:CRISPR-associated protein (TIGR03986 family)